MALRLSDNLEARVHVYDESNFQLIEKNFIHLIFIVGL